MAVMLGKFGEKKDLRKFSVGAMKFVNWEFLLVEILTLYTYTHTHTHSLSLYVRIF